MGPADPWGSTGPITSSACQLAFGVWTRTVITPFFVTLSTVIVVPVFGGFTPIQPGLYEPGWSAAPCLSRECHQVWVSSNFDTALRAGRLTFSPFSQTVWASVFLTPNVESSVWTFVRSNWSPRCTRPGWASTGRIWPSPGWSPTLLSLYSVFQYEMSAPGWNFKKSTQFDIFRLCTL